MKKEVLAAKGGQAIIECKPRAAPKPKITWSRGTEILKNSTRLVLLLSIVNNLQSIISEFSLKF